ncbi:hypothetical protein DPMN_143676 [Dreissena polymorpha]|uniref:Uncharacterized protein n=1 Tax=Dreissena polymorpha TaxID=45954 RepID=A0A9D4GDH3_DREPO|nr:hypothetical protein DPMN_143676 [Dreissena polymorpha]
MAVSDILSDSSRPNSIVPRAPARPAMPMSTHNFVDSCEMPIRIEFFMNSHFYGNVVFNFHRNEQTNTLSQQQVKQHRHVHHDSCPDSVRHPFKRIRINASDSDSD